MIWLDVTTLMGWRRPPVGIIRTELELARHAINTMSQQARFCRFTEMGYVELAAEIVAAKVDEILNRRDGQLEAGAQAVLSKGGRLRTNVVAAVQSLPSFMSRPLLSLLGRNKPLIARTVLGLRHVLHKWREKRGKNPHQLIASVHPTECCFAPGDLYFSAGLDWADKGNAYLGSLRQSLGLKVIRTCYDIIPAKYPHLSAPSSGAMMARYFVGLAQVADFVICISKRSRSDLTAFLDEAGVPMPPSAVIRLGDVLGEPAGDHVVADVPSEFILYVSTIERRKNHEAIVRAISHLVDAGHGAILPKVVFVGMNGWGVQDLLTDINLDPRLKGRIIVRNNVPDIELQSLYRSCLFTVFPSFYEGWGLGAAESLAMGKFCIVSNAGSLPEVGGDLVDYVDPIDGLGWADRLLFYVQNRDELHRREARIRAEYRATSWDTTARQAFAIVQSLEKKPD